jgi:hypothetical protein
MDDQRLLYNRELLLLGPKRNEVLDLWEVQRYGNESFGNVDYVSIFGMRPFNWYARGVRLLGRTVVECTPDELGDAIGADVAGIFVKQSCIAGALVVDPFVGSANTLYWLLRHLPGSRGLGFESDAGVFRLTHRNIEVLKLAIDVVNTDYVSGLSDVAVGPDELLILFIAPPWGNALKKNSGLDLRRTIPPITEIVDYVLHRFSPNRLICAIQVFELVVPVSLAELRARFDWSTLRIYELNSPGQNHGLLLGTKGCTY